MAADDVDFPPFRSTKVPPQDVHHFLLNEEMNRQVFAKASDVIFRGISQSHGSDERVLSPVPPPGGETFASDGFPDTGTKLPTFLFIRIHFEMMRQGSGGANAKCMDRLTAARSFARLLLPL